MSFWSDASPLVKGAIVVGALGIIVGIMMWTGVGPFNPNSEDAATTERGLPPPQ